MLPLLLAALFALVALALAVALFVSCLRLWREIDELHRRDRAAQFKAWVRRQRDEAARRN